LYSPEISWPGITKSGKIGAWSLPESARGFTRPERNLASPNKNWQSGWAARKQLYPTTNWARGAFI
jgi:hypothetical protein